MTNEEWLAVFREIGRNMRAGITEFLAREGGLVALGRGAGGDKTFPVDRWAEDIILSALEKVHRAGGAFTFVSEELGRRKFGEGGLCVLADPIDGSNNAKSGVPFFSTSLALLDGATLGALAVGYVMHLATGDEFWAMRGAGAYKNGRPMKTPDSGDIVIVAYEASNPAADLPRILPLLRAAKRTRCYGSTALDLAYLASGAMGVFVTASPSRPFDFAAGMIIVQEAGGVVTDLAGRPLDPVAAGLERTVPLLACKNAEAHRKALAVLAQP